MLNMYQKQLKGQMYWSEKVETVHQSVNVHVNGYVNAYVNMYRK